MTGSFHKNVGPFGGTHSPWLVRYSKESLYLPFTLLTGGKSKYKISYVFSSAMMLVNVDQRQWKVVGKEGTDRKYRMPVQ